MPTTVGSIALSKGVRCAKKKQTHHKDGSIAESLVTLQVKRYTFEQSTVNTIDGGSIGLYFMMSTQNINEDELSDIVNHGNNP